MNEPHLPSPSIWPATLGAGVTLMALGVVTTLFFVVFGLVVLAVGLAGWIGELRHG